MVISSISVSSFITLLFFLYYYNTIFSFLYQYAFSALTLLVGRQEGIRPVKNMGEWWRWALVSPDGVAPSRMVSVSASVNLPLHHNVQKFTSGTGSPSWSQKKGCKTVLVWCCGMVYQYGDGVSKTVEKISSVFSLI